MVSRDRSLGTPPRHVGFGKRAATTMSGETEVAVGRLTIV